MNNGLKYICALFSCNKRLYEIYKENRNILYFHFVKFKKYLIHETALKISYWVFSLLLIVDNF